MDGAAEARQESEWAAYRVDDLIIDIGSQRVMRGDQEIPLPQRSFEFFLALARAAPNVLSVDQLMERVWPGLVVGPETVSQRVKVVRDALGDDSQNPRYIAGVRGRGYRMVAQVVPLPPGESAAAGEETAPGVAAAPAHALNVQVDSLLTESRRRRIIAAVAAVLSLLAVAVIVALYQGWFGSTADPPRTATTQGFRPPKTIAVLPLIDISPGGGNEYLGDGLAEELTDRLTRIPGLRVAARTSAFAFKGKADDVRKIGQSLSVHHVLEGSVRREGERLRVTAQLIDAQSGFHIWSQSYDRTWQDVFDIQDDIARSIVGVLELVLSSEMAERLEHATTESLEAFDLYLTGLSKLHQQATSTQLEEAERIFGAALRVDPKFARAHAGLCETYVIWYERSRDTAMASKAEASCGQALSMDATLREVETALARLYGISGRSDQSAAIFQRILGRNPSDADAYLGLAEAYEKQERLAEAEATYRRAIEVEPNYANPHIVLGTFLFNHGRAGEAVKHYQRATDLRPTSSRAFSNLGGALQMTGNFEAAARALERALELEPTRGAYTNTGTMYYFLGRFGDAEKMFRKATAMAERDHRMWANLADALYQMEGRREEAQREYRRAISLAQLDLKVSPNDADTLSKLAYYQARVGEFEESRQSAARAVKIGPEAIYVHYYVALTEIEHGNAAAALDALQKAVDLGYPVQLVRAGPEFARLRSEEHFKRLISSAADRQPAG